MSWFAKLPWRRIGSVVTGVAIGAVGVVFPPVAAITAPLALTVVGSALPHEWTSAAITAVGRGAANLLKK